jgi:hypothetical protein
MPKKIVISFTEEFDLEEYWANREGYGFKTEEEVIANMKADMLEDIYSGREYITEDSLVVSVETF